MGAFRGDANGHSGALRADLSHSASRWESFLSASHRWWIPLPIDCLSPGEVKAHGQVERTRRRREPVRLVGGAGVLVLDVQVKRAAFVVSQWVAVAEGEAVKRVGNLEAFLVVHRDRPEGVDWWQFLLVEVRT